MRWSLRRWLTAKAGGSPGGVQTSVDGGACPAILHFTLRAVESDLWRNACAQVKRFIDISLLLAAQFRKHRHDHVTLKSRFIDSWYLEKQHYHALFIRSSALVQTRYMTKHLL